MQCRKAHVKYLIKNLHTVSFICNIQASMLFCWENLLSLKLILLHPSVLFKNICEIECQHYDPYIDKNEIVLKIAIYMILTQHQVFQEYNFPEGAIVIDPFRYLKINHKNVNYYPIGCPKLF